MEIDNEAQLRREIGERIRRARKSARGGQGFRQIEVADVLGKKGEGTVSSWETGRALPDAMTLRWMAQNYGVSVDELLVLKEPQETTQQPLLEPLKPVQPVLQEPASTRVRRADTIELPISDLVRVIQHAVANGLSDEREVRVFLQGVQAAIIASSTG
ncbi:transcriptional regulator [uncultured Azohydromonas sp.]|uniref:transcriptional regulator n=1 Tax=uncultured Azohydromonas sp. TaxID=487342 RepID=UPI0026138D18|nr:transcriptional regulator [uncultured Azohydromonas sp.]